MKRVALVAPANRRFLASFSLTSREGREGQSIFGKDRKMMVGWQSEGKLFWR